MSMARSDLPELSAALEAIGPMEWLLDRGLTEETIVGAQLGWVFDENEYHYDSIVIPYFDALGRHRSERYRHLRPHMVERHKYAVEKGGRHHLYGLEQLDAPEVFVTEGEFDALILRQMGYAAVGIPGTNAWRREWRFLFRNCDLVVLVMDSDPLKRRANGEEFRPGQDASKRVAASLSSVTDVAIVELPEPMDVTDLYLKDPDELRRRLA
jgi:hypothetical protein